MRSHLHHSGLPESILGRDQSFVSKRFAERMSTFNDPLQMFVLEIEVILGATGYIHRLFSILVI
jgi:hypothetical protein